MSARILDGRATAAAIKDDLRKRVADLAAAGRVPGLGTVLVGDDPGSRAYVNGKHRDSVEVGIASIRRDLPADASQEQVEAVIDELNANPECTGSLVPVWHRVTVAFSVRLVSSRPSERPTVMPRPITVTSAPSIGTS